MKLLVEQERNFVVAVHAGLLMELFAQLLADSLLASGSRSADTQ